LPTARRHIGPGRESAAVAGSKEARTGREKARLQVWEKQEISVTCAASSKPGGQQSEKAQ